MLIIQWFALNKFQVKSGVVNVMGILWIIAGILFTLFGSNDQMTQQYVSLLRKIEWCINHGIQPESEAGIQIAVELMEISNETFGGDEDLMSKFWEVRKKPAEQTGLYPVSEEVLLFVQRSIAIVEEQQKG